MQYSQADINNMRRDALRRTREMHQKSISGGVQAAAPIALAETVTEEKAEENAVLESDDRERDESRSDTGNISGGRGGDPISALISDIFGGGKIDSDKLLIIALIFILAKEGADIKLLLALGYILM